jgi:hypothetical protein
MPIDYKSLLDGTAFTAEELNSRFSGAQEELNALTGESVSMGGLRTEHVESPVGIAKEIMDAASQTQNFVGYNSRDYGTDGVGSYNAGDQISATGTPTNPEITFGQDLDLFDEDQRISALVIMYNQFVLKFVPDDGAMTRGTADYGLFAHFTPRITFSDGSSEWQVEVPWATRAISPGLSQRPLALSSGGVVAPAGSAWDPDEDSMKDVAIRAVITKDDIASLVPGTVRAGQAIIKKIDIAVYVYSFGVSSQLVGSATDREEGLAAGMSVRLHKGNLTVIPIQAEVEENLG